ncbi:MAG TPA: hypothetical protein ENI95_13455 [Chloroflexi bacterium]|nr:hypothetical protein [Chloroflexota bacterium]
MELPDVKMLDQVTESLFIGDLRTASAPEKLKELGITSVLKLYESPPEWPEGFILDDSPIPDGRPVSGRRLDEFIGFITREIGAGRKVLVVCAAGISRSATVVLAYLVSQGMSLPEAYRHLRKCHPRADPHPALWESLIRYFNLHYTWGDILEWRFNVEEDE